jgi:hypothetical protein
MPYADQPGAYWACSAPRSTSAGPPDVSPPHGLACEASEFKRPVYPVVQDPPRGRPDIFRERRSLSTKEATVSLIAFSEASLSLASAVSWLRILLKESGSTEPRAA